jgi:hypothetical protein
LCSYIWNNNVFKIWIQTQYMLHKKLWSQKWRCSNFCVLSQIYVWTCKPLSIQYFFFIVSKTRLIIIPCHLAQSQEWLNWKPFSAWSIFSLLVFMIIRCRWTFQSLIFKKINYTPINLIFSVANGLYKESCTCFCKCHTRKQYCQVLSSTWNDFQGFVCVTYVCECVF